MLENAGKTLENDGKTLENALKPGKARKCAGANAGPRNLSALQRPPVSGAFQYYSLSHIPAPHRVKLAVFSTACINITVQCTKILSTFEC